MSTPPKVTFFTSQTQFRTWLERNHAKAPELWVGFYKRRSGRAGITYRQALDEALCWGWIDGVRKGVDDISYTTRFTPRKPKSNWSLVNIDRARELTKRGQMTAAGLKAFDERDEDKARRYSYEQESPKLDRAYEKRFRANAKAWGFFQSQPAGYKRTATWWVMSAKREETRMRRLATLIEDSTNELRLAMLRPPSSSQRDPRSR
jgi:uncharacterized protein YdeI (YjbR/CyaY-like superfamily)